MIGPEIVAIERLDLLERDFLEAIDVFIDGRHVADVVARIMRQQALEPIGTEAAWDRIGLARARRSARFSSPRSRWPAAWARGGSGGEFRARRREVGTPGLHREADAAQALTAATAASSSPSATATATVPSGRSSCRGHPESAGGSGSLFRGSSAGAGSSRRHSGP